MNRKIKENLPVLGAVTIAAALIVGAVSIAENPKSFRLSPSPVNCDNNNALPENEPGSALMLGSRVIIDGTGNAVSSSSDHERLMPQVLPGIAVGATACQSNVVISYHYR